MDVTRPYTAVSTALDTTVLAMLARTTRPLTGREIARLTGRSSHSGVLDVLNRLSEHGLIDRQEAGRAWLYTLNREHLAAPAVEALAGMREALLERIGEALSEWRPAPVHASLFGSAARADGDTHSDIDVFVVRPRGVDEDDMAWAAQRDRLASDIHRWTGNRAGLVEVGEQELDRLLAKQPPIVGELQSDAITLHGSPVADLLGDG